MRPTTGPTTFHDDAVGTFAPTGARPFLESAQRERRICREGDPEWTRGVPVRRESIPVTREGQVIAVIERSTNLSSARTPSRLELTYLKGADDLAQMVASGMFPGRASSPRWSVRPRVGDGLLRLGRSGKVSYASPNALSAYRRLGLAADLVGAELGPLTARLCAPGLPTDDSLMVTASGRCPRETEVEGNGSVVQLRAIPLVVNGLRTGALVLVRDVTELRHRERELMTKDATIREIHHRVKNNLQTVAALLRLQSRRLDEPKARAALDEAVRRVGSIATVHETLSHAPEEIVDFDDVAQRVAAMAGEVSAAEARVKPGAASGRFGLLPSRGGHAAGPGAGRAAAERAAARPGPVGPGPGPTRPGRAARGLRGPQPGAADGHCRKTMASGLPEEFDLDSQPRAWACRSSGRSWSSPSSAARLEVKPRAGGGTSVQVSLPVEAIAVPSGQPKPGHADSARVRAQR